MQSSDIELLITEKLNPETLIVTDTSGGCGAMFSVIVVSSKFEGMSRLKRHRLVNSSLGDQFEQLHALSLKTLTPEQYKRSSQL